MASLDVLSKESESPGLRVSWVKTKIQNFLQTVDQDSSVSCCGEEVDVVDVFPYFGCQITPDGKSEREITSYVGLAWGGMYQLGQRMWHLKYLSRRTKVDVFKRLVLPALLYGCETWTLVANRQPEMST